MNNNLKALRKIKRELKHLLASTPILSNAKGAGRLFELYVMVRIAKRLDDIGWKVTLLRSDGSQIPAKGTYVQRGGAPSGVAPASGGVNGPSTIKIEKNGIAWELWNGVQFAGRSKAFHELDIAVVPHDLAVLLRNGTSPSAPFGRPPVAIECKDVGATGTPDEMRAFIGRLYDLTVLKGHLMYLGIATADGYIFESRAGYQGYGTAPSTFLNSNDNSMSVLARRTGFSSGADAMTNLFRIRPYAQIDETSGNANIMIADVAHWIDTNLI